MSDVGAWLARLGLGQYSDAFIANDIDVGLLSALDHEALKELGVTSVGHFLRILKAANEAGNVEDVPVLGAASPVTTEQAERRQLSVMFCDLVGSTELAQRIDAEELRGFMRAYQDAAKSAVEAYGGYIARYMGDGVLAYFGFPKAHEDDAQRAVLAGLELCHAVPELQTEEKLAVRVGIATGSVVVGDLVGEGASAESAVVGETPNLAARLQAAAMPNTVVVSESTKELAGGLFEYAPLGVRALKGIERPVPLWQAINAASASRFDATHERVLTPFSGRAHELAELLELLRTARSSGGRSVLVVADAGVGKSRLLHELRVNAKGWRTVVGQCLSHGTNIPLHPLLGVARELLGLRAAIWRRRSVGLPRLRAAHRGRHPSRASRHERSRSGNCTYWVSPFREFVPGFSLRGATRARRRGRSRRQCACRNRCRSRLPPIRSARRGQGGP